MNHKKSNPTTKMKRTGPTNIILLKLVAELKKRGNEQEAEIWRRIANDLERPTRQRRVVNLSSISRYTKENEVIVVPGKVLGSGDLEHKLTISAFQFSDGAKEKIEKAGSKIVPLLELSKDNPSGKGIRIIG
ncbi:MAG TPA: 50S ribosomal protein L18e [Candidatus Nanoarchaeia archaeon]|nr:50S ribosomal protein L18e [Candidatus Nanoarchaeia archaeon]